MNRFDEFNIGQSAEGSVLVTEKMLLDMANISNDYNPIHISDEYAKNTPFRKRIAHGLVCEALISNIIGTKLPGPGAIFIGINIKFKKPVYIDDLITAQGIIAEKDNERSTFVIDVTCYNQNGDIVVSSQSKVKYCHVEV